MREDLRTHVSDNDIHTRVRTPPLTCPLTPPPPAYMGLVTVITDMRAGQAHAPPGRLTGRVNTVSNSATRPFMHASWCFVRRWLKLLNKDKTENGCMLSDTGEGEEGDRPNGGQQASSLTANSCSINVITDLLNFGWSLTALKQLQLGRRCWSAWCLRFPPTPEHRSGC